MGVPDNVIGLNIVFLWSRRNIPSGSKIYMGRNGMDASRKQIKYTALMLHGDEVTCERHEQMGFHDGWGKALDQLVALAKKM